MLACQDSWNNFLLSYVEMLGQSINMTWDLEASPCLPVKLMTEVLDIFQEPWSWGYGMDAKKQSLKDSFPQSSVMCISIFHNIVGTSILHNT